MGGNREHQIGLDVVRSVAILLVLLAHFAQRASPHDAAHLGLTLNILGHLGVELFFVLSGFLIGGLLLDICERGASVHHWRIFMARRMMRTVPAYMLCVALLLVIKPVEQVQPYLHQYLTFTQNLAWPMPPTHWFAVSWSLAVEEWFYLLFSIVLLGLSALAPRKGFWIAIAAFLIVPVMARVGCIGDGNWDNDVRKVVVLRLDAIAYGVLLARVMRSTPVLATCWRSCMALGLLLLGATVAYWYLVVGSWNGGGAAWRVLSFNAVSVGLALLFPAALHISMRPSVVASAIAGVSTLSYGMYLYHSMMLDWVRPFMKAGGLGTAAGLVLAGAGTVLAAYLSYRFLERPILALRPVHDRKQPAAATKSAMDSHLMPV